MTAEDHSQSGAGLGASGGATRRWIIVGGLLLLVVAAGTRLIRLGQLDLWGDEIYTYIPSTDLVPNLLRWETLENESSSPLPFLEAKVSRKVFGNNAFALRLPSALHGVLGVLLLYLLVGRFTGRWGTAFASGLFLAVNPFALDHGREGRMYTQWLTAILLVTFMVCEAVRYARDPRNAAQRELGPPDSMPTGGAKPCPLDWRWWLLGVTFAYAHACNVLAVFNLLAIGLGLGLIGLITLSRNRRQGWTILLGTALATGVYLSSWALTGIAKLMFLGKGGRRSKSLARSARHPVAAKA